MEELFRVIVGKLTLISIILDEKDNPHRIFESLNGKGRPLSQADLIRNFFFMRLPEKEHERVYVDLWRPMQRRLGEDALTDFVRHYLTRFAGVVRESDVYAALKERVDGDATRSPMAHLKEIAQFSEYYEVLLRPEKAPLPQIAERLKRLSRLDVTVTYPFLLGVYADLVAGARTPDDVCSILETLENFLIRRFVCGIPTHGLNKSLATLYDQANRGGGGDFTAGVCKALSSSTRGYPRDEQFRERLGSARLYGGGDRREKTKFILERLEAGLGHKESVTSDAMTIEHVMPQTVTDSWKQHLGTSWEEDHEELLHTLGNLTLTGYNAELSNAPFERKKEEFAKSHVELNRYFAALQRWSAPEIEARSETLIDQALALWPYFGEHQIGVPVQAPNEARVTGTVPTAVRVRESETRVSSWVEVAVVTIEAIASIGDEEFERVTEEMPTFVNRDATLFRRSSRLRKLSNGAYLETNHAASTIYRLCLQAAQLAGLGQDEWEVDHAAASTRDRDASDPGADVSSQAKQLQLEFWNAVRVALQATGKFSSLQTPRPQQWFDIALGRSGIHMSLSVNTLDHQVGAKIVLMPERAERALELLLLEREAIEREVGTVLSWNPHPEKRIRTIKLTYTANLLDRNSWPDTISWLSGTAVALHGAFATRVKRLDLELQS